MASHNKTCQHCGSAFVARRSDQKWCSRSCGKKHFQELNVEKIKADKTTWDLANKGHVKIYERKALQSNTGLRRYRKDYQLRRYFGISLEQYEELLDKQEGLCAICKSPPPKSGRNFAVDHAHSASGHIQAGEIRGLLCWQCNTKLIGKYTDPNLFQRAADYLKQGTGFIVPSTYTKGRPKSRKRKSSKTHG